MRITHILAAFGCFVWAYSSASAQVVTQSWSANIAGMVGVDVPRGGLVLGTMPFEGFQGAATVSNTLANQLPSGTEVRVWSVTNAACTTSVLSGAWSPGGIEMKRGMGFWLTATNANAWVTSSIRLYLAGSVPSLAQSTTTVDAINGQEWMGYPYPVDMVASNITYLTVAGPGSKVYLWNVASQSYLPSYTKSGLGSWPPALRTAVIHSARGFILETTSNVVWTEVLPCTWL